jgi:hypothetical protein
MKFNIGKSKRAILFALASVPLLAGWTIPIDPNKVANTAAKIANSKSSGARINLTNIAYDLFAPQQYTSLTYWKNKYEVPGWLQRTEIDLGRDSFGRERGGSVSTVQPIYMNDVGAVFAQGRANLQHRFGESLWRTTLNLGVGYRQLFNNDTMMLGGNLFYDVEMPRGHHRIGFGADLRASFAELNANYYLPRSKVVFLDTSTTSITERAREGWDLEAGLNLPYMPWAKVYAKRYHWKGYAGADMNGHGFSVQVAPLRYLQVEVGLKNDNIENKTSFIKLGMSYNFASPMDYNNKIFADVPYEMTSMREHRLDQVRRENTIIVERVVPTAAGGNVTVNVIRAG